MCLWGLMKLRGLMMWSDWINKDEGKAECVDLRLRVKELEAELAMLQGLLTRYRKEVPVGNQPHMICLEVDKALEVDR